MKERQKSLLENILWSALHTLQRGFSFVHLWKGTLSIKTMSCLNITMMIFYITLLCFQSHSTGPYKDKPWKCFIFFTNTQLWTLQIPLNATTWDLLLKAVCCVSSMLGKINFDCPDIIIPYFSLSRTPVGAQKQFTDVLLMSMQWLKFI